MAVLDDGINAPRKDRPRNGGQAPKAPEADKGKDKGKDAFKVADHNVDEVKDFVEEHPDQADAVLAAEERGENRKTLVEWLNARKDDSGLL